MKTTAIIAISFGGVLALGCTLASGQEIALRAPDRPTEPRVAMLVETIPSPSPPPTAEKQLTLAEAEAIATANHPALRGANAMVQAAKGNWVQVGLRPNPTVGYMANEMGNEGKAGQHVGYFGQTFKRGGKLKLARAVAARETESAEEHVEVTRWQVVTTVRLAYFELLGAERALSQAQRLHELAVEAVDVVERRLKAAEAPRTALLESQIESESTALAEQQATERVTAARRRLATMLGDNCVETAGLEDVFVRPLPELAFEPVRERMVTSSPELIELQIAVDRARWAIELAKAGRKQDISVQAGVQYDAASEYTSGNMLWSMPFPLNDRNQGAIAQAYGELTAAQAALDAKKLDIQEQFTTAYREYRTAQERITKYSSRILPAAKESLELTTKGYQQGQLDYTAVYVAQQAYISKEMSYVDDLQAAWQKWAEIDGFLVGELNAAQ